MKLLYIFLIVALFVACIAAESNRRIPCDGYCDCDEVNKGCPKPRLCKRPHPRDQTLYIQCSYHGGAYTYRCREGQVYNDQALRCVNA
ncbi:hypothetical protein CYY_000904 [Polysphondylium violaceum]|uniref:Chitin-binding type-2 domain-containing protein n=1 Tax=Polysphondylium violaceum TaxID=133409 RepID=A0A8J4Q0P2_9MYCE|nr:hypothetical protein CYY_000904 [Polysphondylium violaceum]